jgi:hypothetical protein
MDSYLRSHILARELLGAAVCLVIGVVVMPCLIFAAGRVSLGPYEHGGVFGLWRDFLAGLESGSEAFWFVALGPYLLYWLLRGGRRLLHN